MALEWLFVHWLAIFKANGLTEKVAREEYRTWAEGLGGELDNEFQQNELSVKIAAKEAIQELKSYEE